MGAILNRSQPPLSHHHRALPPSMAAHHPSQTPQPDTASSSPDPPPTVAQTAAIPPFLQATSMPDPPWPLPIYLLWPSEPPPCRSAMSPSPSIPTVRHTHPYNHRLPPLLCHMQPPLSHPIPSSRAACHSLKPMPLPPSSPPSPVVLSVTTRRHLLASPLPSSHPHGLPPNRRSHAHLRHGRHPLLCLKWPPPSSFQPPPLLPIATIFLLVPILYPSAISLVLLNPTILPRYYLLWPDLHCRSPILSISSPSPPTSTITKTTATLSSHT